MGLVDLAHLGRLVECHPLPTDRMSMRTRGEASKGSAQLMDLDRVERVSLAVAAVGRQPTHRRREPTVVVTDRLP